VERQWRRGVSASDEYSLVGSAGQPDASAAGAFGSAPHTGTGGVLAGAARGIITETHFW
jgi:hypothetical protein